VGDGDCCASPSPSPCGIPGDDGEGEEGEALAWIEGRALEAAAWLRLKGLGCDACGSFSVWGGAERMRARALAFARMLSTCFALGSMCNSSDVSRVGLPRLILQNTH